jgi:hypothetical protein
MAKVQPITVGAPEQMEMMKTDIFGGNSKIMVKQEFALMEMCGCEAKNRYRVSVPKGEEEGPEVFLYVSEESSCFQRLCCSVNRALTLNVHQGSNKEGTVVQAMHKPFHCQGCCCMRPKFMVWAGAKDSKLVGSVEDPWRCCAMDQQILDEQGKLVYTTNGSICQLGLYCPFCAAVDFEVKKDGTKVGMISKRPMTFCECFKKTNRFIIDFPSEANNVEKRMVFAAAMLIDLEYFEQNKNNKNNN